MLMVSCVSLGYSGVLACWRGGHLYLLTLKDMGGKWSVKTPPPTNMSKHPRCLPANKGCITSAACKWDDLSNA